MRRLAGAGLIGLAGAAGTAVFGWARAKGLAVTLGPAGLGVYGQLWAFVLYAGQLAGLGIGVGTTAFVAAEREKGNRPAVALASAVSLAIPLAVGVLILAVSLAAAPAIGPLLLDSSSFLLLALAAASIPFVAVQNPLQHVIQGFEDAWGQNVAYLVYGAGFTLFAVVGAAVADVEGAALGLTLGNVLLAGVYLVRTRQLLRRAGTSVRAGWTRLADLVRSPVARTLLRVGAGALAIAVVFSLADLAVRTVLLQSEGEEVAGLWFAMLLISVQFIGIVGTAMSYFTAPITARSASRGDRAEVQRTIDDSVRLALVTIVPLLGVLAALRDPVVTLLFTDEFSRMADYLPAQLAGDLARTLGWTLGVALVPLGYTAAWVGTAVGVSAVFGVAGSVMAERWGLGGAVAGWVIMWSISLVVTAAVLVRRGDWRPSGHSLGGTAVGVLVVALGSLLPGVAGLAAVVAGSVLLVAVAVRPRERRAVVAWARSAREGRRAVE